MKLFYCETETGHRIMSLNKIIKNQKAGKYIKIIRVEKEIKKGNK